MGPDKFPEAFRTGVPQWELVWTRLCHTEMRGHRCREVLDITESNTGTVFLLIAVIECAG